MQPRLTPPFLSLALAAGTFAQASRRLAPNVRYFSAASVLNAFKSMEGQKVPSVVWPARSEDQWIKISSDDIFAKGRTVAVLSLPGAFTPTCSSTHLPRYNELVCPRPIA